MKASEQAREADLEIRDLRRGQGPGKAYVVGDLWRGDRRLIGGMPIDWIMESVRRILEIEPDPPSAELLPASVPSSSQPVPLSPARPQEGGVPTHQCTKFGMCEGCGSCYCGRYVRDELEGVPV